MIPARHIRAWSLHKIVLPEPLRYSEDLDYVRATHGPIGPLLGATTLGQSGLKRNRPPG